MEFSRLLKCSEVVVFTLFSHVTRRGIVVVPVDLSHLEAAGEGWHSVEPPHLVFDAGTPPLPEDTHIAVLAAVGDHRDPILQSTIAASANRRGLAEAQGRQFTCGERRLSRRRWSPRSVVGPAPMVCTINAHDLVDWDERRKTRRLLPYRTERCRGRVATHNAPSGVPF